MEAVTQSESSTYADLPDGIRISKSQNRKHKEVIVFVHHFGGTKATTRRHQQFCNELGFDCLSLDLKYNDLERTPRSPTALKDALRGFRHVWADQVSEVLQALSQPAIVYSFSFPGSGALEAIARQRGNQISGWICEGGPFLQAHRCYWNYMNQFYPQYAFPIRFGAVMATYLLLGIYDYKQDIKNYFQQLPNGFPILSIRAWQDRLVPISAIDEFFQLAQNMELEILSLPEADHLQGLKEYPKDYIPRVEKFLKKVAHDSKKPKSQTDIQLS